MEVLNCIANRVMKPQPSTGGGVRLGLVFKPELDERPEQRLSQLDRHHRQLIVDADQMEVMIKQKRADLEESLIRIEEIRAAIAHREDVLANGVPRPLPPPPLPQLDQDTAARHEAAKALYATLAAEQDEADEYEDEYGYDLDGPDAYEGEEGAEEGAAAEEEEDEEDAVLRRMRQPPTEAGKALEFLRSLLPPEARNALPAKNAPRAADAFETLVADGERPSRSATFAAGVALPPTPHADGRGQSDGAVANAGRTNAHGAAGRAHSGAAALASSAGGAAAGGAADGMLHSRLAATPGSGSVAGRDEPLKRSMSAHVNARQGGGHAAAAKTLSNPEPKRAGSAPRADALTNAEETRGGRRASRVEAVDPAGLLATAGSNPFELRANKQGGAGRRTSMPADLHGGAERNAGGDVRSMTVGPAGVDRAPLKGAARSLSGGAAGSAAAGGDAAVAAMVAAAAAAGGVAEGSEAYSYSGYSSDGSGYSYSASYSATRTGTAGTDAQTYSKGSLRADSYATDPSRAASGSAAGGGAASLSAPPPPPAEAKADSKAESKAESKASLQGDAIRVDSEYDEYYSEYSDEVAGDLSSKNPSRAATASLAATSLAATPAASVSAAGVAEAAAAEPTSEAGQAAVAEPARSEPSGAAEVEAKAAAEAEAEADAEEAPKVAGLGAASWGRPLGVPLQMTPRTGATPRGAPAAAKPPAAEGYEEYEVEYEVEYEEEAPAAGGGAAQAPAPAAPAAPAGAAADVAAYMETRPDADAFAQRVQLDADRRLHVLENGAVLVKYNTGKGMFGTKKDESRMTNRWVALDSKHSELQWGDPKTRKFNSSLRIADVTRITYGHESQIFSSFTFNPHPAWLCFSIEANGRTVDFAAANEAEVANWVCGLSSLMTDRSKGVEHGWLLWRQLELKMQGEVQDTGFGGMVKRVAQRVELGSSAGHIAEPAAPPAVPKPPTPRSGPQPPPPQAKAAATAAAAPQAAADEHGGADDYSVYSYSDDGYGRATGQGEPEV